MSSILNNDNLALLTALTTAKLKTGNLRNQLDQLQTAAHPDQAKIDELNTEIIAAEQYENETLKRPPPDSDLRIGFAIIHETQVQKLRHAK